jgi:hypothetical protein
VELRIAAVTAIRLRVAAYNKALKSERRVNTIQVFALPEDVARRTPLLPAASATSQTGAPETAPNKKPE